MNSYMVKYVETTFVTKKTLGIEFNTGVIDGYTTSKDVEALLIEQADNGYELISMVSLTESVSISAAPQPMTTGIMITFKLRDSA